MDWFFGVGIMIRFGPPPAFCVTSVGLGRFPQLLTLSTGAAMTDDLKHFEPLPPELPPRWPSTTKIMAVSGMIGGGGIHTWTKPHDYLEIALFPP